MKKNWGCRNRLPQQATLLGLWDRAERLSGIARRKTGLQQAGIKMGALRVSSFVAGRCGN